MPARHTRVVLMLAVAVVVLAAAAIAGATGSGSDIARPADSEPPPDQPTFTHGPRATSVPAGLSERFGILRRGRRAGDDLPAGTAARMDAHPNWDYGENPHLARRALDVHGGLFVVPGSGGVCLEAGEGAGGCNTTESAERGEVLGTVTGRAYGYADGEYRVSGIAVDGVDEVVLHMEDGRSFDLPVTANVYTRDVKGEPATIEWDGPDGHHELAVPH
jgi:hypothetical protein